MAKKPQTGAPLGRRVCDLIGRRLAQTGYAISLAYLTAALGLFDHKDITPLDFLERVNGVVVVCIAAFLLELAGFMCLHWNDDAA